MPFIAFLAQAVIISLSGVMAPGPMTAVTVGSGTKSPHAGALVAIGHGIVEIPLMVLVFYGVGHVLTLLPVRTAVFFLGGLFLLFMGTDMLRSMKTAGQRSGKRDDTPLVAGILFSLGNAYFLLWWVTVGATLIAKAVSFGLIGFAVFAVVHWSCDFVWFYLLSAASFKGGKLFGAKFQRRVFGVCGIFLLVFGLKFVADAVALWRG